MISQANFKEKKLKEIINPFTEKQLMKLAPLLFKLIGDNEYKYSDAEILSLKVAEI